MAMDKTKAVGSALTSALFLCAGLLLPPESASGPVASAQAQTTRGPGQQQTQAAPRAAPPARTDRYGDPLPEGALVRLGTLRFCQPFPSNIAYAPDGKFIASGGCDNRIRLWDPDTGKELRILEGHTSHVNCIALSGDGKLLASGSQDNDLRLWEVETGKVCRRFLGHHAPIECLALSPNGKVLASSCLAGTLRLWDTDSGKEIRSLPIDKPYRISSLAFTPDSKRLAFDNRSGDGIQLVDVVDGKVIRVFKGHQSHVFGLVFSADGTRLISGSSDGTIRVWGLASGKELRRYGDEKMGVRCLALAPDGKTLTYGTLNDGFVHIWDLARNKHLVPPWKAHRWCVVSIAYSPDSKKVVVARDTIAIHETATGKRLNPSPENESQVRQVAYAPDGKVVAVWRADETIELWDTAPWRKRATLRAKIGNFTSMTFSRSGRRLTTAESDYNQGFLCHWDVETGKREHEFPQGKGWLEALSYSADGFTLAGSRVDQHRIVILWDAVAGKERDRIIDPHQHLSQPCLSPDGTLVAFKAAQDQVALRDLRTRKVVRHLGRRFALDRELLLFSPDGRTIGTPGGKGFDQIPIQPDIVLWETATGEERLHINVDDGPLSQLAFSPDGRLIASAGRTETIRLWDAWTGKQVGQFTGHRGWVNSLAFAPDGKTLVSGGADSTVLVWDVAGLPPVPKPPADKFGPEDLARCWQDLAGTDATRAYQAMAELTRHPAQAEDLLKTNLAKDKRVNRHLADRLPRLIADLDAEDFQTREKATNELATLGRLAEHALNAALDAGPSAEANRRIRDLLQRVSGKTGVPAQPELLRAIEVLERLGTPEACRLLAKLATDATDPNAAREAKTSLARLGKTGRAQR